MIETLGPIRQSSPIEVPAVYEVITQWLAISTWLPMCNGPSVALIFTQELITVFLPRRRLGVISTSAFGLILAPYFHIPQRVTTKPGTRKRRSRVPSFMPIRSGREVRGNAVAEV